MYLQVFVTSDCDKAVLSQLTEFAWRFVVAPMQDKGEKAQNLGNLLCKRRAKDTTLFLSNDHNLLDNSLTKLKVPTW